MTVEQIVILLNGAGYVVLWFFVRMWISDVKKSINDLHEEQGTKISKSECSSRMRALQDTRDTIVVGIRQDICRIEDLGKKHRHTDSGEVIIR